MADFQISYKKSLKNEGLYADLPYDNGKETYMGVSRRANPTWRGWNIIDRYKKKDLSKEIFVKSLGEDKKLQQLVEDLYKMNYWNVIRGNEIKHQAIADSIFDSAVNMGCVQAIKLSQRSLYMSKATGIMDDATLSKLNA